MWKDILKGQKDATQYIIDFLKPKLDNLKMEVQLAYSVSKSFPNAKNIPLDRQKTIIKNAHLEIFRNYQHFLMQDDLFMKSFEEAGHALTEVDWEEAIEPLVKKLDEVIDEVIV